jgi:hypothetical protein
MQNIPILGQNMDRREHPKKVHPARDVAFNVQLHAMQQEFFTP